jgi:hypothetical protein
VTELKSIIGKTISDIRPSNDITSSYGGVYDDSWVVEFTDGTQIEITASYDDSAVHIWQHREADCRAKYKRAVT